MPPDPSRPQIALRGYSIAAVKAMKCIECDRPTQGKVCRWCREPLCDSSTCLGEHECT